MKNISIAIVDDDRLVAELLSNFLTDVGFYQVIFVANEGRAVINKLESGTLAPPHIILLDLKMEGMNGVETIKYLVQHFPSIKIIVISSYYKKSFTGFLFKIGVAAFVPKGISLNRLTEVINTVFRNGLYFTEEQFITMRDQISNNSPKPIFNNHIVLSQREMEVLKLICMQKTAKEIGDILFITVKTVEGHKNNLFIKTGAKNIVGLVIYAMKSKLLNFNELV